MKNFKKILNRFYKNFAKPIKFGEIVREFRNDSEESLNKLPNKFRRNFEEFLRTLGWLQTIAVSHNGEPRVAEIP